MGHIASYPLVEVARRHHRFADRVVSALPLTSRALERTGGRSVARRFVPPLPQSPQSAVESDAPPGSPDLDLAPERLASAVGVAPASPIGARDSARERAPIEEALRPSRTDADERFAPPNVPVQSAAAPEPRDATPGDRGGANVAPHMTHTPFDGSPPPLSERKDRPDQSRVDRPTSGGEISEAAGAEATPSKRPSSEDLPGAGVPHERRRAATQPTASDPRIVQSAEQAQAAATALAREDQQTTKRVEPYVEVAPVRQHRRRPAPQTLDRLTDDLPGGQTPPSAQGAGQGSSSDLFAPVERDRSPASWHTRLVESARREASKVSNAQATATSGRSAHRALAPESSSSASTRRVPMGADPSPQSAVFGLTGEHPPSAPAIHPPSPDPLPDQTRRFLAPLVGIDPGATRIHQGQLADSTTAAMHADALSMGDEIALSSDFTAETPERLGLLAHELTHVARSHESSFVPPIAREAPQRRESPTVWPVGEPEPPLSQSVEPPVRAPETITVAGSGDEESVATQTEARVIELARARTQSAPSTPPHEVRTPRGARPTLAPDLPARSTTPSGRSSDAWNGIPAPWEPLPGWMSSPSSAARAAPAETTHEAPSVQRAATDRSIPETSGVALGDAPTMERAAAPEPDLDALAQRVHTILKRRLAVERRREG